MNKFYHSVRLDADLCKGCINCIKRCPTEAIRVRGGKAQINSKFCIDCGECIRVCPHHAKHAVYDKLDVLKKYEYTVALPAPSLYSQFNNLDDVNIVLNALLLMGFNDVFEVSAAAEMVSEATREYISAHEEKLPLISTACPSVVRLIRVRFPNLIPHMLPAGRSGGVPGSQKGVKDDRTAEGKNRNCVYFALSVKGNLCKSASGNRKKRSGLRSGY